MKNFKTILLILFAVVIVILIFFLVKNLNNSNNTKAEDKLISEIKYMDNKLTGLLNGVNNILLENYKISITKTSTNAENKSNNTTSKEDSSSKSSDSSSKDTEEKYSLKEERILTDDKNTDWETIKNEIEILYSSIPTMTLDLYNMNINQDEILNFNKELDELTVVVKEENKEETLIKLANLYRYLPIYANNFSNNLEYITLLETKSNVFNGYVFANLDRWDDVSNSIKKAIESYSKNLSNLNNTQNNLDTQKIYIILNELQSAVEMKDKDIFLIKYKNFLEETEKKYVK